MQKPRSSDSFAHSLCGVRIVVPQLETSLNPKPYSLTPCDGMKKNPGILRVSFDVQDALQKSGCVETKSWGFSYRNPLESGPLLCHMTIRSLAVPPKNAGPKNWKSTAAEPCKDQRHVCGDVLLENTRHGFQASCHHASVGGL